MFVIYRIRFVILLTAMLCPATLLGQDAQPTPNATTDGTLQPASLAAVLEKLAPESRAKLGEMLAADWKDRPEWADMLVGLLKSERMTSTFGWFKPAEKKYDWNWLASRFDSNADAVVSKDELPAGTPNLDRLFSRFDRDNDGQLRGGDFDYSSRPATPPSMMSQFLSAVLDGDSNGRITAEELNAFLARADKDQGGFLTSEDLYRDFSRAYAELNSGDDDMPSPDTMLAMFSRGELGVFEVGPRLGDEAPDFTLPTHDGSQTVTLSKCRGKPVILIFGSFTCGAFRSQAGILDKLYQRYKDQVDVFAVYIREAHPADGWKMKFNDQLGVSVDQPKTQESRNLVASSCCRSLLLAMPLLVDTINDQVNRAYSGFPERLYLIDRAGQVVYKGGRGPYGHKPRELEQSLLMLLLDEAKGNAEGKSSADPAR